ncbi:MAG: hypothetical protein WDZ77_00065 [Candidatus Pacearchaeota archaeon]
MKGDKCYLWIFVAITSIVAVLHLVRAILGWSVTIHNFAVPVWFSYVVFVVIGFLSYKLYNHIR